MRGFPFLTFCKRAFTSGIAPNKRPIITKNTISSDHDILEYFLDFLTGLELYIFRQVSKAGLSMVDEYTGRHFTTDRVFSPFFTPEQTIDLRKIQAKFSVVVSGSAAVQFFDRVKYRHSDLDLYVDLEAMRPLASFIESAGYVFKNNVSQNPSLKTALAVLSDRNPPGYFGGHPAYNNPGIREVFSFEEELSPGGETRHVQMIVSKGPVMAAIFEFHSTVVMNIITYQNAISIFPVTSFHRYETLIAAPENEKIRREAGLEKYASRGWKVIRLARSGVSRRHAELQNGVSRRVGDRQCWTIPLPPVDGFPKSTLDPLCLNTWSTSQARTQERDLVAKMQFLGMAASHYVPQSLTGSEEHRILWTSIIHRHFGYLHFLLTLST
ncbi:hypothetical protein DL96DRAFT_1475866 [Flagelloscypha sp. PMI_526]|nr:hypothetical protein DL96DRAFT_1475866 [Flagelloscypha sp. PMI_526]